MKAKVRTATLKRFNFICVIGKDEVAGGLVDVRARNGDRLGKFTISKFITFLHSKEPEQSDAERKMQHDAFYNKVNIIWLWVFMVLRMKRSLG